MITACYKHHPDHFSATKHGWFQRMCSQRQKYVAGNKIVVGKQQLYPYFVQKQIDYDGH